MQKITEYCASFNDNLCDDLPVRALQFGEGNFMRAFVDWMLDVMNRKNMFNGKVIIVQPIERGLSKLINEQKGLYTCILRGIENGSIVEKSEIIRSVHSCIDPYDEFDTYLKTAEIETLRFVFSNTTEAGISYVHEAKDSRPPLSYPAKLTLWLYHRFCHFSGADDRGVIIIPCELIDRNGDKLRECIDNFSKEWHLPSSFINWIDNSCRILNSLVDRIVTGYPQSESGAICEKLGYEDQLLDTGEIFHLWVIESFEDLSEELPFKQAGLNVIWTNDMTPYRTRKVRILNGAHTLICMAAYMAGIDSVQQCTQNKVISDFMRKGVYEEIIPNIDLPADELEHFAESVFERFANPFINHQLINITLNSVSKYRTRVLPSVTDYIRNKGIIPTVLLFGLAALIRFYACLTEKEGRFFGNAEGREYEVLDDRQILDFFHVLWNNHDTSANNIELICKKILEKSEFWGEDLSALHLKVSEYVKEIFETGIINAMNRII